MSQMSYLCSTPQRVIVSLYTLEPLPVNQKGKKGWPIFQEAATPRRLTEVPIQVEGDGVPSVQKLNWCAGKDSNLRKPSVTSRCSSTKPDTFERANRNLHNQRPLAFVMHNAGSQTVCCEGPTWCSISSPPRFSDTHEVSVLAWGVGECYPVTL